MDDLRHDRSTHTSSSLLAGVQANDAQAWQRLVKLYSPLVYSWGKRFGLNNQDAADVLQEVFYALARSIHTFEQRRTTGSFRAWLWTLTRNKIRDHFRKPRIVATGGSAVQQQLQEVPEEEPPTWSEDGEIGRGVILRRVLELIRSDFEPHTWQAFWRLAVEKHSAADIGRDLQMKVDAVYQAKARVLKRLREELGDALE